MGFRQRGLDLVFWMDKMVEIKGVGSMRYDIGNSFSFPSLRPRSLPRSLGRNIFPGFWLTELPSPPSPVRLPSQAISPV